MREIRHFNCKFILTILLLLITCICLCSCGKKESTDNSAQDKIASTSNVIDTNDSPTDNKSDADMATDSAKTTSNEQAESTTNSKDDEMKEFYIKEIDDDIFARIDGISYKSDCTTAREDLRYLHLLYKDFDDETQEGEMICNKAIADDLIEIFEELYKADYQIESIKLVDDYDADDEKSMAADNSSCFNFRFISHTTTVSNHGLGLAVDINPLYNPYIKTVNGVLSVEPANSTDYVDRTQDFAHKIDENDLAYKLFTEHGFTWGGAWTHSKDYQHFEKVQ